VEPESKDSLSHDTIKVPKSRGGQKGNKEKLGQRNQPSSKKVDVAFFRDWPVPKKGGDYSESLGGRGGKGLRKRHHTKTGT